MARPLLIACVLTAVLSGDGRRHGGQAAQGVAPAPGTISGCLTDLASQAIPTGWIVVRNQTLERLTRADGSGCYRLDLPPGIYAVRATVPGFCDGVREHVTMTSGERTTVSFALRVGPISESIAIVWRGWADLARRADAVVHLRVEEILETKPWPSRGCGSDIRTEFRARILSIVKAPALAGPTGEPIRLLSNCNYDTLGRSPFQTGEEFVAFLAWAPDLRRLTLTDTGLWAPVRSGLVRWVLGSNVPADQKRVTDFVADLRALLERSQKSPTADAHVAAYAAFVAGLPTDRKESVLQARDELLEYLGGGKRCGSDAGCAEDVFERFRTFYNTLIRTCDQAFWTNRPAQDTLGGLAPPGTRGRPLAPYDRRRDEARRETPPERRAALEEIFDFRDCGIDFWYGEGNWYLRDDPDFLIGLAARLPDGEYKDYVTFTADESRLRVADDGSLAISVDALRQMIVRWDRFTMTHPEVADRFDMAWDTDRLLYFYLVGIDNSPAFDRQAGRLNPDRRESLARFLATDRDCRYYPVVARLWDLLEAGDFRRTKAVESYLQKSIRDPFRPRRDPR